MTKFLTTLEKGLEELALTISLEQKNQCEEYCRLLMEWNEKINLTAIKDEEGIAIKHFLDSLAAGQFFQWDQAGGLLDLGAGAGFPGLLLKIWQPDRQVTLVDSVQKKVRFLELTSQALGLEGIEALHIRAEDLGRDKAHREKHAMVVARAVAPLVTLVEYCLPLLAMDGCCYALKGPGYLEELETATTAIHLLGGVVEKTYTYKLPIEGDQRSLIVIRKIKNTPKTYPRKSGLPSKEPLIGNDKPN